VVGNYHKYQFCDTKGELLTERLKAEYAPSRAADFTMTALTTIQDVPHSDYAKHGLTRDKLRMILDKMLLLRRFEEKI